MNNPCHYEQLQFCTVPSGHSGLLYSSQDFNQLKQSSEPLASHIADVKEAAIVLRLLVSEAEVVSTIVDGLNPVESSRAVFSYRPHTFPDLDTFCINSTDVAFTDQTRESTSFHFR
ncbi:hypothetical protein PR048_004110 [Dryococelus australis]|uniref:Uncharacterized protein n=1 Tax=Dryococelus australis TaxID=614101 RepID=A0ABQ9I4L1_9NEOP|nr:hypothetical protein PR048_004110 [Dryococelus australis]